MFWSFSHKVSGKLFERGWQPDHIRNFGMARFAELCKALKANGYSADRAALLFSRLFTGDAEALDEMRRNTGLAALTFLGFPDDFDE